MSELAFHRPRKVTLVEGVVEQIIEQIRAGSLKPGDRLPSERQLIETLQVGRSSVREALQGLAVMGFVEIRPGQGTFVARNADALAPDIDGARQPRQRQYEMRLGLIDARRLVECETARLAALHRDGAGLERLQTAFATYRDLTLRKQNLEAALEPHNDFHMTVAHIGGNPFYPPLVSSLLRSVPQSLRRTELIQLDRADLTGDSLIESELALHARILDAIAAGKSDAAMEAMAAHMDFERQLVSLAFADESGG